MPRDFAEDGVSFSYPDDWRLEREEAEDGWTVTVRSVSAGSSKASPTSGGRS